MKSVSSRRKIDIFLRQNNDFRQTSMKSLRNSMKSASSRRKINVFPKQNNNFRQKSLKSLRNFMKSASSRRTINDVLKQNNDFPAFRPSARLGPAEPIYINSRSTAKRLLLVLASCNFRCKLPKAVNPLSNSG